MEIKYKDPGVFRFEVGPDDDDEERCTYIHRVCTHPSIKFGGSSLGRCTNKKLPGMTACYIHADRDAMAMRIRLYAYEIRKLVGKI